jgi:DNA polymerase elongation subunit (family B)
MQADQPLRDELCFQLERGNAHMPFEEAVANYPMEQINTPFTNGSYTAWHLLEHLRLTQWDILDFIRNPSYQVREWPREYWPAREQQATPDDWRRTIQSFRDDQQALRGIVMDPATDLWARIPHGTGQTIAREIMVVVDHNAYHVGEFAIMRQVMGTWGPSHDTAG